MNAQQLREAIADIEVKVIAKTDEINRAYRELESLKVWRHALHGQFQASMQKADA